MAEASTAPRIAEPKKPRRDNTHWLYIGVIVAVIAGIVFGLVALLILVMMSAFQIFQLPAEFFVAIAMIALAYFSLRDIHLMSEGKK